MPTTTETTVYNSFLTTTTKNYATELTTQAITHRPAVGLVFDEYRQTDSKGGATWQGMVDYGQSANIMWFNGSEQFPTNPQEFAQPIRFDWKHLGGTISATKVEMIQNSGPVALASLWKGRMNQLMRTYDLVIGNEIFSDGSNFGGKSFQGLAAAFNIAPLTQGTFAGLDPNTWGFWQNNYAAGFGSFAANGPNGTTDAWITVWNNCTDGTKSPAYIMSAQNVFEWYHKTCNQPIRFVRAGGQGDKGDVTWATLEYMGKPWYWDRQCPAGRAYFVPKEDFHMVVDPRMLWDWTPNMSAPDQLTFTRICTIRMFARTKRRMFGAVIDGITA